tara:strand:+ start:103 stop:306 length:204 start_codon:yes stop_codon:yes gene_type:complete
MIQSRAIGQDFRADLGIGKWRWGRDQNGNDAAPLKRTASFGGLFYWGWNIRARGKGGFARIAAALKA